MPSARRKKFRDSRIRAHIKEGSYFTFGKLSKIIIPFLVLVIGFAFFRFSTRYWNGHDKVSFVTPLKNGDVEVVVLDPKLDETSKLIIPGDTEVDVAENYGVLKIKNVWQLSQNEKRRGRLLPETVTQDFLFPTTLWSKEPLDNIWKFIFNPEDTNIAFGDRVTIGIFALRVPTLGRTEINLGQSQFLKKTKLSDGSSGYQLVGTPSERLTIYFADNDLTQGNLKVNIVDATGVVGVSDTVGEIIQVLGGKVVSIDKKAPESTDCLLLGSNKVVVRKIATLFSCQIGSTSTNFDVEIHLGANFAKRF